MKKIFLVFVSVLVLGLTSCEKKGNSYEFAYVLYPEPSSLLYADQTVDSLKFSTTFDWSLACSQDWLHFKSDSVAGTVHKGTYVIEKLMLQFDANTTDTLRHAIVNLYANGNTLGAVYYQLPILNITIPSVENLYTNKKDNFILTDSAGQQRDSIVFCTYGEWTLTFDEVTPDWLHWVEGTSLTGNPGTHKLYFLLDENTDEQEREAVLNLSSKGVTTPITIKQLARDKEEGSEEQ